MSNQMPLIKACYLQKVTCFSFKLKIMDQEDISKILVETKYRVPTIKGETAHFDVDIPKASIILAGIIDINKIFKQWCTETKRSGGVLVGSSIREFFEYYKNYNHEI